MIQIPSSALRASTGSAVSYGKDIDWILKGRKNKKMRALIDFFYGKRTYAIELT